MMHYVKLMRREKSLYDSLYHKSYTQKGMMNNILMLLVTVIFRPAMSAACILYDNLESELKIIWSQPDPFSLQTGQNPANEWTLRRGLVLVHKSIGEALVDEAISGMNETIDLRQFSHTLNNFFSLLLPASFQSELPDQLHISLVNISIVQMHVYGPLLGVVESLENGWSGFVLELNFRHERFSLNVVWWWVDA